MPVTIKAGTMKYKSSTTGQYVDINAVSDNSTAAQLAAIEAKGVETIASIPNDYTELTNEVDDLKSALEKTNGFFLKCIDGVLSIGGDY